MRWLPALLGLGALTAAVTALLHPRRRRAVEGRAAARLPLGPAGIVRGAEPIALAGDPTRAALVLHGFGDTPQSVAELARALHADGWTVRVPLLPGHGRTVREFAASGADAWLAAARAELAALRATHATVALVGQSMGGALASVLAAEAPDVAALVLLVPYVVPAPAVRAAARVHRALALVLPYVEGDGARSIHDPAARAEALGYGVVTPRLVHQLTRVADAAWDALPRVRVPTRVVLSTHDHRVSVAAGRAVVGRLGAAEQDAIWLEESGHVVAVDRERARVFAAAREWLGRHATRPAPAQAGASTAAPVSVA